jgi:hypothetical protein
MEVFIIFIPLYIVTRPFFFFFLFFFWGVGGIAEKINGT